MTQAKPPRSVLALTAGLAVSAVLVGVRSTDLPVKSSSVLATPLFLVALVLAGALPTVFTTRDEHDTNDLFEAALTPVVFLLTGVGAVVLAAGAKLISLLYLRVQPLKVAFNVAQWACVAAVASAVYQVLGDHSMRGADVVALGLAMVAGMLVNHLSVALVVALVSGRPRRALLEQFKPVIVPVWIVGGSVNLSFGLLFAAITASSPAAIVLVVAPLLTLFHANRGHAAVRADRLRLEGLQRATHELAAIADPIDDCESFLDIVRAYFESDEVELVLLEPPRVMRSGEQHGSDSASFALAKAVAALGTSCRIVATEDGSLSELLGAKRHRDCIATLLRRGPQVVGALLSYGRGGLEGFEEGELAVLEALAAEAASALHRGELVAAVVHEQQRLSDILARSSDGILSLTADGTIDMWNMAMEAITGYAVSDLGRRPNLLRLRDSEDRPVDLARWSSGAPLPSEIRFTAQSGEERWLGCSYSSPQSDGSLVVVARDITRARELEQLKEDFIATVTHELKTPLTTIRGFTQILIDPPVPPTEAQTSSALAMIRKGTRRLERLVYNLLEVSHLDAREIATPTQPLDLVAAVAAVVADHQESWPNRPILLVAERPVQAQANEVSIEQVVGNLITNAVRYAPDGPIEVRVFGDRRRAVISVTDHGPGIAAADRERIFERFERLHHSTSRGGTGLGLYIARRLTTGMGGTLTVESEPGEGSTFTVELPAASHLSVVEGRSA